MARLVLVALLMLACSLGPGRRASTPRCQSDALTGRTTLQGATGSLLGGFGVVNRGPAACRLGGPVRIIRLDSNGRRLPLAGLDLPRRPQELVLGRGQGVSANLRLSNACAPGGLTGTLYATFDHGGPRVDLHRGPGGRCDLPGRPPGYAVDELVQLSAR